ncbi:Hcp family type VI secretion system effector [Sphingomonas sp. NCPPB 2930]
MAKIGFGSVAHSIQAPQGDSLQAMYIKPDGIDGESKDSKHSGWIDVLAWGFNIDQASSSAFGAGVTTGKANVDQLWFDHYVDKATATLWQKAVEGKSLSKVQLHCARISGDMGTYLDVTLENVIVSQISVQGAASSPRVIERVGLSFTKMKAESKAQDEKGSLVAGGNMTWDIKQNKG